MQSINASVIMGLKTIVFHPGYYSELTPNEAMNNCVRTINKINEQARLKGYKDYILGAETVGKKSQFGSLLEVIELCKEIKNLRPVVDFAHVHAREGGILRTEDDFAKVFELIEKELGKAYLKGLHCHFAEIEYTGNGEVRHLNIGTNWQPDFRKLAKVIKDNDYSLRIICESPLLDLDAVKMKTILEREYK